ncbi:hypothetical protein U0070_002772, partial [Myodes glareolus]
MDAKNPKTLVDLAVQCLLGHESAAIQALEDIPRNLFVPLFIAAFKGGHKNILNEMVKVWPFYCLHLGTLTVWDPHHELLKAMIENLPVFPAENSASWVHDSVIQACGITSESFPRVLPTSLDFLYLSFCDISYRDFRFLAQCPQASHLKMLNLSNNAMHWDDFEPFQTLLLNHSGTLKHLEINHCLINDSAIAVLIPALMRCTQLHILAFASNPITMPMLVNIMHSLTPLMKLKYVIYPIPLHCYERWHFQGRLDRRRLAIVQLQLKAMLQVAGRRDMKWTTHSEGLNISNWKQIKKDLQKRLQKKGADSVPISTFSLWCLVCDALLTDKVKVRLEVVVAKEILEEIQEEETCCSIGWAESHRGQMEMTDVPGGTLESGAGLRLVPKSARFRTQNQIAITSESENGEDSLSSSAEKSLSDEEAQLIQEIKVLQKRLKRC